MAGSCRFQLVLLRKSSLHYSLEYFPVLLQHQQIPINPIVTHNHLLQDQRPYSGVSENSDSVLTEMKGLNQQRHIQKKAEEEEEEEEEKEEEEEEER